MSNGGLSSAARELEMLRPQYEQTLEALRHQALVIDRLEELLLTKVTPTPLQGDAAAQTDPIGEAPESLFVTNVKLKLELMRLQSQREQCYVAQAYELACLERDLAALRADVVNVLPAGVHVQGAADGRTAAATAGSTGTKPAKGPVRISAAK